MINKYIFAVSIDHKKKKKKKKKKWAGALG